MNNIDMNNIHFNSLSDETKLKVLEECPRYKTNLIFLDETICSIISDRFENLPPSLNRKEALEFLGYKICENTIPLYAEHHIELYELWDLWYEKMYD